MVSFTLAIYSFMVFPHSISVSNWMGLSDSISLYCCTAENEVVAQYLNIFSKNFSLSVGFFCGLRSVQFDQFCAVILTNTPCCLEREKFWKGIQEN